MSKIVLYLTAAKAEQYAAALERGGLADEAESLRARIPLEGPAPWRNVVDRDCYPILGSGVVLTETLACGHKQRRESRNGTPTEADRRRCHDCQTQMRREAGWLEHEL